MLPAELAEHLKQYEYTAFLHGTENLGTIVLAKLPAREIASVAGPVPMHLSYQLFDQPAAPVIRMVTRIYDQPRTPLALESFINIAEEDQRSDFAQLATQDELYFLFFDEAITHRLSKHVQNAQQPEVTRILEAAEMLRRRIPQAAMTLTRETCGPPRDQALIPGPPGHGIRT
ncbi:MAG: hypothetical protein U0556_00020 [Dehalococcoidia bacterium]